MRKKTVRVLWAWCDRGEVQPPSAAAAGRARFLQFQRVPRRHVGETQDSPGNSTRQGRDYLGKSRPIFQVAIKLPQAQSLKKQWLLQQKTQGFQQRLPTKMFQRKWQTSKFLVDSSKCNDAPLSFYCREAPLVSIRNEEFRSVTQENKHSPKQHSWFDGMKNFFSS